MDFSLLINIAQHTRRISEPSSPTTKADYEDGLDTKPDTAQQTIISSESLQTQTWQV